MEKKNPTKQGKPKYPIQSDSVRLRTLLKATAVTSTIFKMKGPQIVLDNWNSDCELEWV